LKIKEENAHSFNSAIQATYTHMAMKSMLAAFESCKPHSFVEIQKADNRSDSDIDKKPKMPLQNHLDIYNTMTEKSVSNFITVLRKQRFAESLIKSEDVIGCSTCRYFDDTKRYNDYNCYPNLIQCRGDKYESRKRHEATIKREHDLEKRSRFAKSLIDSEITIKCVNCEYFETAFNKPPCDKCITHSNFKSNRKYDFREQEVTKFKNIVKELDEKRIIFATHLILSDSMRDAKREASMFQISKELDLRPVKDARKILKKLKRK